MYFNFKKSNQDEFLNQNTQQNRRVEQSIKDLAENVNSDQSEIIIINKDLVI